MLQREKVAIFHHDSQTANSPYIGNSWPYGLCPPCENMTSSTKPEVYIRNVLSPTVRGVTSHGRGFWDMWWRYLTSSSYCSVFGLFFAYRAAGRPADGEWRESAGGADVTDDVDCDADDAVWLDAALVAAASDAEVAGVAPPRAPRVGAQLDSHAYTDSDLIAFHVYASWFSPPSCG